ncbi:hypothetical protein [Seonamhaeicola marinus]|uniref:Glycosyltransferase RgtA/B/C/D-like domain-containing protein n=1 Tax=Seonamhaeicola marinus TaxID=1912246 RepID=A0A5D0HJH2_9FLAO|nr:hypothetical protein [Seonamhaeicola marinus]TYA71534.1 hypothetical protein FUA24_18320 [Seonamhaeicola marinus]
MSRLKKYSFWYLYIGISIFLVFLFFVTKDIPFFWDGLTKSQRADWIFENNFKSLIVPNEINSGHPPLWIFLLALFWKLFGKTVLVSRVLLLLVNLCVYYQLLKLFEKLALKNVPIILVLIVCLDPTLIAQSTSLNNDMLLLFFSLFALNSILSSSYYLLILAYSGLLLTNLRGIYMLGAFSIIHLFFIYKGFVQLNRKLVLSYLIPLTIFGVFAYFQYSALGWAILKDNSHRKAVNGNANIIKNILAYIKCYLDYGRVFIVGVLILKLKSVVSLCRENDKFFKLMVSFIVVSLVLFFGTVLMSNPIGDRYYILGYILLLVIFVNIIERSISKYKKITIVTAIAVLLTGHLWIYPVTISQAWDSSLAHLNYFPVKEKMENYLEEEHIETKNIGTRLPMSYEKNAYLSSEKKDNYASFSLRKNDYIFISNVDNKTKDDDIYIVTQNWEHVKTFSQLGVFISLYKNPK